MANKPKDNPTLAGLDLHAELDRVRGLNVKLAGALSLITIGVIAAIVFAVAALTFKPEPDRMAVDPMGRVYPVSLLTTDDPPDSRVTRMVGDCVTDLLNHPFHNYQTGVEKAISGCFTGGGSQSIRVTLDPLLAKMKTEQMNMASNFVILPFINNRRIEGGRRVYNVQGVVAVGYRGRGASAQPITYAFSTDVVRVAYDSHIEGIRLQNLLLEIK